MKVIFKNNMIYAFHSEDQNIDILYPDADEITYIPDHIFYKYQNRQFINNDDSDITPPIPTDIRNDFTLEEYKEYKLYETKKLFEDTFKNGVLTSSLGFPVDCRRYGYKNDKDNLQSLMQIGIYPIDYLCADGIVRQLNFEQANIVLQEMIRYGLQQYQKKWNIESIIANATDIETIKGIRFE